MKKIGTLLLVLILLLAGVWFLRQGRNEEPVSVGESQVPESFVQETEPSVPETEIEPVESLKEESLEADHDDFVNGLAQLRTENDQDKEFVPDIVVNPDQATILVGDQVQESAVEQAEGEALLDSSALEEALEGTALEVPEGDQISVEELAQANDLDQSVQGDGTILLADTYQTCRLVVKQVETDNDYALADDKALSVVGPFNGTYIFQYESPDLTREAHERWNQNEHVSFVEPEKMITVGIQKGKAAGNSTTASSSYFSYKDFRYWGASAIGVSHMKSVVKEKYGSVADAPKVKVAVIDTGIDYNHPWFKNRLVSKGYDFVNGDKNATDDYMHGTACAGIIAKSTTSNVKILPLKAGDCNGSLSNVDIYNALEYAIAKKVSIVSMSFGCLGENYSEIMKEGIDDARAAGLLLIAAYGNNGVKTKYHMPAGFDGVVGVSSVNVYKQLSDFSNYGSRVDISAPGEDIYCAVPKFYNSSRYEYLSGTSMSTPYVAAAAAMFKTLYPKYSAKKITKLLYQYTKDLGKEGKDNRFGNGMIYLKKVEAS